MRVVICGGGVIGASIAYFLSRRGVHSTVIERCGVGCAASENLAAFLPWIGVTEVPWKHWPDGASGFMQGLPKSFTVAGVIAD